MSLEDSEPQRRSEIATRIRERRRERGLTQEALAQRAEVSKSFMSELEAGGSAASGLIYLRIASALEVSIQWLLTGQQLQVPEEPINPLSRVPIVSELADEMGWSHRKALDVAEALARVVARRSGKGQRWEPSRENVMKIAEAIAYGEDGE